MMVRHSARSRTAAVLVALTALTVLGGCQKSPLFAPTGATITLSSNSLIMPVNGTAQITATVVESGGTAVSNGTTVTFTTTLGSFVSNTATTNAGRAVVTFNAGSQSGTATITAFSGAAGTAGGTGAASTTSLSIAIGAASVSSLVVTANPANVSQFPPPLGNNQSTVTATVLDTNNNGIPGVSVAFSTDQGQLSTVTATTNSLGVATTTLTTSQAATVTATVGGKTGTAKVSVFAAPTVTIMAPSNATALALATFVVGISPGAGAAPITDVTVNFGDGTTGATDDLGAVSGTGLNLSWVYADSGHYTFTVTVKDGTGQTVTASAPITVFPALPFTLTVSAAPATASVQAKTEVVFTATPNAGAPTTITSYLWNFGDGSPLVSTPTPSVSHPYNVVPGGGTTAQILVTVTATPLAPDTRLGYGSITVTVTQ